VHGVGPNFNEGVKAATVGVGFSYLHNWQADLSYTAFFGGRTFCGTDVAALSAAIAAGRSQLVLLGKQSERPRLHRVQYQLFILMPSPKQKDRNFHMNEFCLTTRGALLRHTALALAMSLGLSGAAFAQDASQLGKTLTPVGAERAGNAAGTIPAWDGGITKPGRA
jgi:hypothetical protein